MECPACGKQNKNDAHACAFCPESFEVEEGPSRRKRRIDPNSWPWPVWLALTATGLFGIWRGLNIVMTLGEEGAKNPLKSFVDGRTTVPSGASDDTRQIMTKDNYPSASAGKGPTPSPGAASETALPEKAGEWRLSGTVFDLVTLKPVPGGLLIFSASHQRLETKSDRNGHYRLSVPILERGGYEVKIRAEGYASSYLNPGAERVPQMPLEDRQGLAKDLAVSGDGTYSVQPLEEATLVTDFYLAPGK